jgi:hypothetical protein
MPRSCAGSRWGDALPLPQPLRKKVSCITVIARRFETGGEVAS